MKARSTAKILSLIVAVLMITMTSGCQYILPKEEEPLPPPLVEPRDVVYVTANVTRGDMVQSVQGVGRLESVKMIDVFFKAGGGRVKSINAKIGDMVKKGDVLLQLDTEDLDFRLQVERLHLKQMQNNYAVMQKAMKRARDKTQLTNAEIDLQIEKLNITQMETEKENATLRAPIDGSIVYMTTVNQGSTVDAYTTLARVADQSVKMLTYTDELNRAQFQVGMKVQVTLKSDGSKGEGEVVSTPFERDQFDSEKTAKMLFIKVPDDFLKNSKVGDEANLLLVLAERKGVLKLPRNVVRTYLQRRYVQVLVNNVKVEKDVQVGLETPTETEIISGLEEGEKVIVR
jgi:membrane fusion protein, macrolide-specific efflux system